MTAMFDLDWKQLSLRALVGSLCITAGLAILALLLGDLGEFEARLLGTTALLSGFSLLSFPGAALLDQGRREVLAWALIALAAASFLLAVSLVWSDGGDEATQKLLVITVGFTLATAVTAAGASRRRDADPDSVAMVFRITTVFAYLSAAMAALATIEEIDPGTGGYFQLLGSLVVLTVLGSLLQPLLRRMAGVSAEDGLPVAAARRAYRFVCTVDRAPDRIPDGAHAIDGGAQLEFELEEADFGGAVAKAIRELERGGAQVVRVERAGGPG